MLKSMTGQQLSEWMEYAGIEPFGETRADLRMGILAASLINNLAMMWTGENPHTKPTDFLPDFEQHKPDPADVASKLDSFFSMLAMTKPQENTEPWI